MNRQRYENNALDSVDQKILSALVHNARVSMAELARIVGLSAPSVAERVKRLEDAGVIEGYRAVVNPKALGLGLSAWLRIRPTPGQMHRVTKILQDLPDIVECHRITGDDCFIARVHVRSVEDLEVVIDALISYSMTNTSIIQSSPVPPRLPPLHRVV